METQYTVAANVDALIGFNRSMAVALDKAERGSSVEDMYFIEKLQKTAERLGYKLVSDNGEKPKVVIAVQGGLIEHIEKPDNIKVEVRDYDTENYSEDELKTDEQGDECVISEYE